MWYRIIMVLLMVITIGYPRQQWRWANDSMEMTFDKEAHLAGSFGLYYMFKYKGFSDKEVLLYTFGLGLLKEVIDANLPYEKYGRIGGDGFSKYDLAYNTIGIGLAFSLDRLWKVEKKNVRNYGHISGGSFDRSR
jgi:hypothetical protein